MLVDVDLWMGVVVTSRVSSMKSEEALEFRPVFGHGVGWFRVNASPLRYGGQRDS